MINLPTSIETEIFPILQIHNFFETYSTGLQWTSFCRYLTKLEHQNVDDDHSPVICWSLY
jgi:hypothetical protein